MEPAATIGQIVLEESSPTLECSVIPIPVMPALHISTSPSWSSSSSDSSYVSTVTDPSYLPPDPSITTECYPTVTMGTESAVFSTADTTGSSNEGRKRKNVLPPPPPPPPADTSEPLSSISYADILRKPQFAFSESYSETDLLSETKEQSNDVLHNSCPDLTLAWSDKAASSWSTSREEVSAEGGFEIEFLNESSLSPQTVNCNTQRASKESRVSNRDSISGVYSNRDTIRQADSIFIDCEYSTAQQSDVSTISYTHSTGLHFTGSDYNNSETGYSHSNSDGNHGNSDSNHGNSDSNHGNSDGNHGNSDGNSEKYKRDKVVYKCQQPREQRRGPITLEHQRLINYFSKGEPYFHFLNIKIIHSVNCLEFHR